MVRLLRRAGALILALSLYSMVGMGILKAQMDQPLPLDPSIRMGRLDNGLTYFIRQNKLPEGRANFYIAQKVGSMQEEDNQSGLAHFLEHIAFNGTKHFPGKNMISWLETKGMRFGSEINAYTSFDETVYTLMNAPTASQGVVDSCLLILHDWSRAISLEDKEIDAERGVIQEEWRSRNSGNLRIYEKLFKEVFPEGKYGKRMPIGSMDVVRNFKYQELRDYYKKWYRPDLQAFIIVGDIDPDKVEAEIKRLYADVPKAVNPAERTYEKVKLLESPRAVIATDPEGVGTSLGITFMIEKDDKVDASAIGLIYSLLKQVIAGAVNERFSDILQKPNAPFAGAYGAFSPYLITRTMDSFSFGATLQDVSKLPEGLNALTAEIERLRRYGLTSAEVDRMKKNILSSVEKAYNERDKRKNGELANEIVEYFTKGGFLLSPENYMQMIGQMLPMLDRNGVNKMLTQLLDQKSILLTLTGPSKEGLTYPTPEELVSAFEKAQGQSVEAPKEEVVATDLMTQKPKAGKIVKEEKGGKHGSTLWTLSNGTRVILLPTTHKEDEILLSGSRWGGTYALENSRRLRYRLLDQVMELGGLADFSASELEKVLTGRNISTSISVEGDRLVTSASSTKRDLEVMLQALYLGYTAPRVDKDAFVAFQQRLITRLEAMSQNPLSALVDSALSAVYPRHPEARPLKVEDAKNAPYEEMMAYYKQEISNVYGTDFVIVGNINPDELRPLVETYLASLPSKKVSKPKIDYSKKAQLLQGRKAFSFARTMETPMAMVLDFFSGKVDYNLRNRLRGTILSEILSQVYMNSIRESEGASYGVSVDLDSEEHPTASATLSINFQTQPERAEELNGIVRRELEEVRKDGVKQEMFDKVVSNLQKKRTERLKENRTWLSTLMKFYFEGKDDFSAYESTLSSIKPEEIRSYLDALLSQGNDIEVYLRSSDKK